MTVTSVLADGRKGLGLWRSASAPAAENLSLRGGPESPDSVNHLIFLWFGVDVWNVERSHRIQRGDERSIELAAMAARAQLTPYLSQHLQNAGTIESLPLAVIAQAHVNIILQALCGRTRCRR